MRRVLTTVCMGCVLGGYVGEFDYVSYEFTRVHALSRVLVVLQLGVVTKGTVLEVNVSDLGLVTQSGKIVWGKYAQVTNSPELDGCINAVLLV